ncbi:DENN domain-containing protein 2D [Entamoeba marina]
MDQHIPLKVPLLYKIFMSKIVKGEKSQYTIETTEYYPKDDETKKLCDTINEFCYPEGAFECVETHETITEETSEFFEYGYCKRIYRPQSHPTAVTLLSPINCCNVNRTLLDILTTISNKSEYFYAIKKIHQLLFPSPQTTTTLSLLLQGELTTYSLKHLLPHSDPYIVSAYRSTIKNLTPNGFVDVFTSLLREDRILFISTSPSILSPVISTLLSLLHPFSYENIIVPLLPTRLYTYVAAPMPFIIGCLRSTYTKIINSSLDLGGVFVFDLDNHHFIKQPTAPVCVGAFAQLRGEVHNLQPNFNINDLVKIVRHFFAGIYGKFHAFFKKRNNEHQQSENGIEELNLNENVELMENKFDFNAFSSSVPDSEVAEFLASVAATQMFHQFLEKNKNVNSIDNSPFAEYFTSQVIRQKKILILIHQNDAEWKVPNGVAHIACLTCSSCGNSVVGEEFSTNRSSVFCMNCSKRMTVFNEVKRPTSTRNSSAFFLTSKVIPASLPKFDWESASLDDLQTIQKHLEYRRYKAVSKEKELQIRELQLKMWEEELNSKEKQM